MAWVKIDEFENLSNKPIQEYNILSAKNNELISVPKGYANGLKALEPNSDVMIFSGMNLEDSVNEKIRYPATK